MGAIEVIPSARRLIRSLRDMGYDFVQAVADIVDNSIEAEATEVNVDLEFEGDNSWVRIADNGIGMKPDALREALRFGSNRMYGDEDLGKFGLGLKTASLSQCERLAVASRWNHDRADIAAYAWDLAHIEKTDKWEIVPLDRDGVGPGVRNLLKDGPGTVVLWHRLDRLLGYKHPYGEAARKRLRDMCRELELHLGMVFERFLNSKTRARKLKIFLNGNIVQPWDPFCRNEQKTKVLQSIELPIEHEGVKGKIKLEPYILPHEKDFSSPEAFRLASGPASWNQQQGFYIYRSNRMIQSGGWSNLRAPDEHVKLARIAVSFTPALDEAFKINVAKMRVQMPSAVREDIKKAISSVVKIARETYDRKNAAGTGASSHAQRNPRSDHQAGSEPNASEQGSGSPRLSTTDDDAYLTTNIHHNASQSKNSGAHLDHRLTQKEWAQRLLSCATTDERAIVERVLARMENVNRHGGEAA